ncbi:MAG: Na+/H+ antiporter subunit E [Acidobacteriota bacterium]
MRWLRRVADLLSFVVFYGWEVLLSNLRVAHDVATPTDYARPGIIAVPIQARSDFELYLLGNLITMTPGTLSLDVSTDRTTLYVHALFAQDPDQVRHDINEKLERRVLRLIRG